MNTTPTSSRIHIAIFGRRNAGKSSLINALTNQEVALVSDVAGTTTDPVSKAMEILPIGPVVIIDTAGLDDTGELGELRVKKTYEVLNRTDLAILVIDGTIGLSEFEENILKVIRDKNIPVVGVINKKDLSQYSEEDKRKWEEKLKLELIEVSALKKHGIEALKMILIKKAPYDDRELSIVGDLIKPGDFVVLVVPIDKAAPKGRLILPQQQTIRDILDNDAMAIVTKEHELKETLQNIGKKPSLVITDSQAFLKVSADTPKDIPLTSFSILFARYKGDLEELIRGVKAIKKLKPGDKVLIAEGCTHHRQSDDIGKVKIPRWIRQIVGGDIQFDWSSGITFPDNLEEYSLIVHCGACMLNRREMMYRISYAKSKNIPIVNYGVLIAYVQGLMPRAIEMFPLAKMIYEEE
ncbi:iron-only hydrogenase maturation protein HydF [Thermoanaerobacter uzonensis DSM 18761]|jgi:[FeFe] hydrogenase H-cluster maturation GTPase HydF|uniref:Iron-only hydrogenase maturation protein HydF n=1 Tax=Thermoanaerobacter uzonensis DSM 18761 TaxID=1123369 RepID=A0A1M4XL45_9THEO|nr:[FeFe] hydrogenase H-cluster maturation GTPase HydF [Thermoanaerobacter uzonensis]SHE94160.1 iron-only hydrogenase maturation protein HydF [Thermoanaerobacter uzonensis DSM 18761]